MFAIHPAADGSTYRASGEEFLSRTPLPLTDVVICADGAMYFTVGGRGTQSELYRVTYVGDAAASEPKLVSDAKADELHKLRRKIETYHAMDDSQLDKIASSEIDLLIANLDHPDRFIGYAARVALEKIAESRWASAVLSAKSPTQVIRGIVGLARTSAIESIYWPVRWPICPIRLSLRKCKWSGTEPYKCVLIRRGLPSSETQDKLIAQLESLYDESWKSVSGESRLLKLRHKNREIEKELSGYLELDLSVSRIRFKSGTDPFSTRTHHGTHLFRLKKGCDDDCGSNEGRVGIWIRCK